MDFEKLADEFWQNGFLYFEKFFDDKVIEHLDQLIENHFGDHPDYRHDEEFIKRSQAEIVPWFPKREGVNDFDVIENHPDMVNLTQAILGDGWYHQYTMSMFSQQGTKGQPWHQDCPPENTQHFNLNRLMYTRDITAEIGGQTVFVPGSHKRGVIPVGDPDEDMPDQKTLDIKKGSLLILHGQVWHRVLPVVGNKRFSTNLRAAPVGTPSDVTDIGVYRNMRYRFSTGEVVEERS